MRGQSMRDDLFVGGSAAEKLRQVGNAVPLLLGVALMGALFEAATGRAPPPTPFPLTGWRPPRRALSSRQKRRSSSSSSSSSSRRVQQQQQQTSAAPGEVRSSGSAATAVPPDAAGSKRPRLEPPPPPEASPQLQLPEKEESEMIDLTLDDDRGTRRRRGSVFHTRVPAALLL